MFTIFVLESKGNVALTEIQNKMNAIQAIYEEKEEMFNYCNISWCKKAVICEDNHDEITVFTQDETIKMRLIWVKNYYYDGTDIVNYSVRAYSGGGKFVVTNYEENVYLLDTSMPDENDY